MRDLSEESVKEIASRVTTGLTGLDVDLHDHGAEPFVYVETPLRPGLTAKQMDARKAEARSYKLVEPKERLLSYKEFIACQSESHPPRQSAPPA